MNPSPLDSMALPRHGEGLHSGYRGEWEVGIEAEERRIKESGAKESAAIFMDGVELCKEIVGDKPFSCNHTDIIEIPGWHERYTVDYFGGNGAKHFQLITSWGGEMGKTRSQVFTRKLRDDEAKRVLPEGLRNRLLQKRDKAIDEMVVEVTVEQLKQMKEAV